MLALIGLSLIVYFAYHLVMGERSYIRLLVLEQEISSLEGSVDKLNAERTEIEQRVVRLRPDTMDKDMLEQRVREVLGYVHPDEHVILSVN